MTVLRIGDRAAQLVSQRVAAPVANIGVLSGIGKSDAADGQLALDLATGKTWRFSLACALTGDDLLVSGSGTGNGRWLLMPGAAVFSLPITFATADAAVLWTLPTGCLLQFHSLYWGITTNFSGGSSSAIGVSSTRTNFTTKGDLLGGSGGDVAATLVAASVWTPGTIGAKIDAFTNLEANALWTAGHTIRFDQITSVFTAGVGSVNINAHVLLNAGA